MEDLIKLYQENLSKFIEDTYNIKLFSWQKFVVDHMSDIQNSQILYQRYRHFTTLRELEKYITNI